MLLAIPHGTVTDDADSVVVEIRDHGKDCERRYDAAACLTWVKRIMRLKKGTVQRYSSMSTAPIFSVDPVMVSSSPR